MSIWAMLVIAAMYGAAAIDQFKLGNYGLGIAFAGWAFGQLGMAYTVR